MAAPPWSSPGWSPLTSSAEPDPLAELAALDAIFSALAHPARRQILLFLQLRGGALGAGEIAGRFACRWPTISRHLKVLVAAGLLEVTREGRERRYTLASARLTEIPGRWLAWFQESR